MPQANVDKPFWRLGSGELSLRNISILLILAGILIPSVVYSINLRNPTPSELLLAICITLFASVVYLWILDATDTLRFRAEWVSKSVYGAAIVSVLGTSVSVYKDFFTERKYPYEGKWELGLEPIKQGGDPEPNKVGISRFDVSMNFSENAESYWGFSNFCGSCSDEEFVWVEVFTFDPKTAVISVQATRRDGEKQTIKVHLAELKPHKSFAGELESAYRVDLRRPN